MTLRKTPAERFWPKVNKCGPVSSLRPELGPCWLWTAVTAGKGYGRFYLAPTPPNRSVAAHRFAYEALVGPIPEGLTIDHLCMVKACVNPAHMEPVTNRENLLRGGSVSGVHARQTHCIHGHEFNEANTHITAKGQRKCRACNRSRVAEYNRKKRLLAAAQAVAA